MITPTPTTRPRISRGPRMASGLWIAGALWLLALQPAAAQEDAGAGAPADSAAPADPEAPADAEAPADVEADAEAPADAEADAEAAAEDADAQAADAEAADAEAAEAEADDSADSLTEPEATDPETTNADADDAEATDAEATDADEEPAPRAGPEFTFANSFFSWTNAVTAHSFSEGAQLSYDPTYVMSFSLTPRFYLTNTTFLWLNQGLSYEATDSNWDTYNREPLLSDTLLDLRQNLMWEGFVFQGQARVAFPTSKASQAARRVLQTGLGLTVVRPFPDLASFTVAATFGYRRWWATTNVAQTGEAYPGNCAPAAPGEPPTCTQASGLTTGRDILIAGLILTIMPLPGLTVSGSGFYMASYGHELAPATITQVNGGNITLPDESLTHWRAFTYFSLAIGYDVLPWLNLQIGVQNSGVVAPLYNPDGSVRSPFNADTQVFLTTTFGLDALYGELFGADDEAELTPEERQRRRQGLARRGESASF